MKTTVSGSLYSTDKYSVEDILYILKSVPK